MTKIYPSRDMWLQNGFRLKGVLRERVSCSSVLNIVLIYVSLKRHVDTCVFFTRKYCTLISMFETIVWELNMRWLLKR